MVKAYGRRFKSKKQVCKYIAGRKKSWKSILRKAPKFQKRDIHAFMRSWDREAKKWRCKR